MIYLLLSNFFLKRKIGHGRDLNCNQKIILLINYAYALFIVSFHVQT